MNVPFEKLEIIKKNLLTFIIIAQMGFIFYLTKQLVEANEKVVTHVIEESRVKEDAIKYYRENFTRSNELLIKAQNINNEKK